MASKRKKTGPAKSIEKLSLDTSVMTVKIHCLETNSETRTISFSDRILLQHERNFISQK